MTYIISEPCVDVRDGACVDVCPVDCIYTTEEDEVSEPTVPRFSPPSGFDAAPILYIHPEECIDCAACEPVCPVMAIFAEEDTPEEWESYKDLNYGYFGVAR